MKGRSSFSATEADEIRSILAKVRRAEPSKQKGLRAKLRSRAFYITDWTSDQVGFAVSDFDELVKRGLIEVGTSTVAEGESSDRALTNRASDLRAEQPEGVGDHPGLLQQALRGLSGPRYKLSDGDPDLPVGGGLYALYGEPEVWNELGLGSPPDGRPLYVGKAEESIISRDLRGHVGEPSGNTSLTGRSTLRRSMVALLAKAGGPDFKAVPRNSAKPERFANYGLSRQDDILLTEWMRDALTLSIWVAASDVTLRTVEGEVLAVWEPPLNLTAVATRWTPQVKAARAEKANQARQSAIR